MVAEERAPGSLRRRLPRLRLLHVPLPRVPAVNSPTINRITWKHPTLLRLELHLYVLWQGKAKLS